MDWYWTFPTFLGPFFGVVAILALVALAFDVWMLVDAIQRPPEQFSSSDAKTWWIVGLVVGLVTGLPALAVAIAYYIVVRRPAVEVRTRAPVPAGTGAPAPPSPPAPPTCRSCGATLVAGASFCHSCGTPTRPEG